MRTVYEIIWSVVGAMLLIWFGVSFLQNCSNQPMHDGVIMPTHQKQTIKEFLDDHPDIKKRVDELNRQAEHDEKYSQS